MNNLFLTGKKGVGKSTIINKIIEKVNCSIGGYITEKQVENNIKTFTIISLYNNKDRYPIAKINEKNFEKKIFTDNFKHHIPLTLDKSLKNRDLIILDELGFMENNIEPFTGKIYEILDSNNVVFGVLKDYNCTFLNNIKSRDDVLVIEITQNNRDTIEQEIINILKEINVPFK
ncbi:MAG: hypothetical protein GX981_03520 [Tissierellia bacterium]|nr:hypothetical protein [Tissierellia bacterium]